MTQRSFASAIELGEAEIPYEPVPAMAVGSNDLAHFAVDSLVAGVAAGSPLFDELAPVLDVPVELTVEIGRTTMTIGETLTIGPGSIIALKRMTGEPVDLLVNGKRIARGEVIAIDEEFGFRVTELDHPEETA